MKKVALISVIPSPYRLPLFRKLAKLKGIKLKVYFHCQMEPNRHWEFKGDSSFDYKILANITIRWGREGFTHITPYLFFDLLRFKPDVILSVGASFPSLVAWLYSQLYKKPIILWWGGTKQTERYIGLHKYFFRKFLFRRVNGFLTYGRQAKEYIVSMGVSAEKVHIGGNVTFDVKEFNRRVKDERHVVHADNNRILILGVGQLIRRKNFILLVSVFKELVSQYDNLELVIVGDGPEKKMLQDYCKSRNISDKVKIAGYTSPENLYEYYAKASFFVHPTLQDHWSQVVNEAMASELAVVVSDRDSAVKGLIRNGENGFIIDPASKTELRSHMGLLIENPTLREALGKKAYETIAQYDLDFFKDVFLKAVHEQKYR